MIHDRAAESPDAQSNGALKDDAPLTLARSYLESHGKRDGELVLRHWDGDFWRWEKGVYRKLKVEDLTAHLWAYLDGLLVKVLKYGKLKQERYKVDSRRVNDVLRAAEAETHVYSEAMPVWLDAHRPAPTDIIAFRNGLLDVPSWLSGEDRPLLPPTPLWFSRTILPYNFTAGATCEQWIKFLHQVMDGDLERINLLQEWFGYCMTTDTSHQKMMVMRGPPRSGKGTITRMLERLIGKENCACPALASLGERFGLTTLVGKMVALCADAHLGFGRDATGVLETLKNVVGEDSRDIDRKNRDAISTVRLYARFFIVANEMPRLTDSSAALVPRMLMLPLYNSYVGKEDKRLDAKLAHETPGVLLWALQGLARLKENDAFTEPQSALEEIHEFERLSSPIKAFVEDCCDLGEGCGGLIQDVYDAYVVWFHENKMKGQPWPIQTFGHKLRNAFPGLYEKRRGQRTEGERKQKYEGLSVKPEKLVTPEQYATQWFR